MLRLSLLLDHRLSGRIALLRRDSVLLRDRRALLEAVFATTFVKLRGHDHRRRILRHLVERDRRIRLLGSRGPGLMESSAPASACRRLRFRDGHSPADGPRSDNNAQPAARIDGVTAKHRRLDMGALAQAPIAFDHRIGGINAVDDDGYAGPTRNRYHRTVVWAQAAPIDPTKTASVSTARIAYQSR